jgi:hypothetical protein
VYVVVWFGDTFTDPLVETAPKLVRFAVVALLEVHERVELPPC